MASGHFLEAVAPLLTDRPDPAVVRTLHQRAEFPPDPPPPDAPNGGGANTPVRP